jgi:hypothetical protein
MMAVRIRCDGCNRTYPWDADLPWPEKCPLPGCGHVYHKRSNVDEDGEIVIAAPFIGTFRGKGPDACYRELETSSERRAQMAADMAGVPVSEMSHLKVTNIRDAKHQGEVAAIPIVNDVTRQMDLIKQRGGTAGWQGQGAEFSPNIYGGSVELNGRPIASGVEPSAGARMRAQLHKHHEKISHGTATSDRPALETQQPGYRHRA